MALSLTQDSGIHHFEILTDKTGHDPYLKCWCQKRHTLDFTGQKRFVKAMNAFLAEHESCQPIGEKIHLVPRYQRDDRVRCETQGITFTGRIAQYTVAGSTVVYHLEAETPNGKTTPVFVEECEIVELATEEEEEHG